MKRKVIKQANQAFTITLPIEWVRKNQINEKSEVNVDIIEKSLIINSNKPTVGGKVKADINGIEIKGVGGILNALYAKGVDEIELHCEKDISSDLIFYLNQNLGYALVEQKQNIYIIRDVKGGETQNLDEIFKRVFQMILLSYEFAIKDIFGEGKETLESLRARDIEVNKFCLYLQRAINKMSYPDSIKGRALFTYSFFIEKIGDEVYRLWKTSIDYRVRKNKEIKELMKLSLEGLGKAFDLYYQFNVRKVGEIFEIRNKIREKAIKLKRLDANTTKFVRYAVKIVEEATDLTPLTLMINLE